jgi:hypothetical protein
MRGCGRAAVEGVLYFGKDFATLLHRCPAQRFDEGETEEVACVQEVAEQARQSGLAGGELVITGYAAVGVEHRPSALAASPADL